MINKNMGWEILKGPEDVAEMTDEIKPESPLKFPWEIDLDKVTPALIEGCIPQAGVGCLFAQPGIGKSAVAIDLAFRIATGTPEWAGRKITTPGDVVYVALEGEQALWSFVRGWRREHPVWWAKEGRVAFYTDTEHEQMQPLVTEERFDGKKVFMHPGITQLKAWIATKGLDPRLIILDTQIDMLDPSVSENDAAPSAQMYRAAQQMGRDLNAFVLFLHHATKTSNRNDRPTYRGSTAFEGKADVMFFLQGVGSGRGNGKLEFTKRKPYGGDHPKIAYTGVRDDDGEDLCVTWSAPGLADLLDDPAVLAEHRRARTVEAIWNVLKAAQDALSTSGVANALRELATREQEPLDVTYRRETVASLLDDLNREGIVANLEPSVTSGKPSKWVSGRRPGGAVQEPS